MSPKFVQSKRQVHKNMDVLWNSKIGNKKSDLASMVV